MRTCQRRSLSVLPYPYKGSQAQKEAVVKEALVRLPLLIAVRQFLRLGDKTESALRKAATTMDISPFVASELHPLLEWAISLGALKPDLLAEALPDAATEIKEQRHHDSSSDNPFIRQLAADLTANGID
ncbi:TPA: hypothetical protein ACIUI9_002873 [Salmonella enterica subsp. enterica serovar 13,23:b:-]